MLICACVWPMQVMGHSVETMSFHWAWSNLSCRSSIPLSPSLSWGTSLGSSSTCAETKTRHHPWKQYRRWAVWVKEWVSLCIWDTYIIIYINKKYTLCKGGKNSLRLVCLHHWNPACSFKITLSCRAFASSSSHCLNYNKQIRCKGDWFSHNSDTDVLAFLIFIIMWIMLYWCYHTMLSS